MATEIATNIKSPATGAWTTLLAGVAAKTQFIYSLRATNSNTIPARVSVRFRKGASTSALIIPGDSLPAIGGANSHPFRIPLITLEPTDFLEVSSDIEVEWESLHQTLDTVNPYSRIASLSGDSWTDVSTQAGPVKSIMIANTSMGLSRVSARRMAGTTLVGSIFDTENVDEGRSQRIVKVTTLATGQKLQMKSMGGVDVVLFGDKA